VYPVATPIFLPDALFLVMKKNLLRVAIYIGRVAPKSTPDPRCILRMQSISCKTNEQEHQNAWHGARLHKMELRE
jgi:hypothetical protein